jgi:SAM-dependent methyltransferase
LPIAADSESDAYEMWGVEPQSGCEMVRSLTPARQSYDRDALILVLCPDIPARPHYFRQLQSNSAVNNNRGSMPIRVFYDELAPRYHLIYENWPASIVRQGEALASIISEHWPGTHDVLDVAAGIGTQSLGLAMRGFRVVGSDLSPKAVERATAEASQRGLTVATLAANFCNLPIASASTDVVICCDNSLPHVESSEAAGIALAEWYRCLRPGGGCVLSMRDYGVPPVAGTVEIMPYGERMWEGHRYSLQQRWTWHGSRYDLRLEMTPIDGDAAPVPVLCTSYLAITPDHVQRLMREVGFRDVHRFDGRFFQPILVGSKAVAT